MAEYIRYKKCLLAVVLRKGFCRKGAHFFTPPNEPLQLGALNYPKGQNILPHIHPKRVRNIADIREVLHIQKGKIRVNFYSKKGIAIGSCILKTGDTVLLGAQGHGIKLLEDSRIIEVKQGPYSSKIKDKRYLRI